MKIAMPSDDKENISGHFGKTKGFMIMELVGKNLKNRVFRENTFTGHARGQHHEGLSISEGHHRHSHQGILTGLEDCGVVIANGMGRKLYDDLRHAGKEIYVTKTRNIEEALEKYVSGKLDNQADFCCSGH